MNMNEISELLGAHADLQKNCPEWVWSCARSLHHFIGTNKWLRYDVLWIGHMLDPDRTKYLKITHIPSVHICSTLNASLIYDDIILQKEL